MKQFTRKIKGVVKGGPSGIMISILIHAAALLFAGMLVVFNVVKKDEKQFVPPKPIERPKMNLKKPKVKIKKSSKPKPTTRIVTKMNKASMPDLQLPEMSGLSDGLTGDMDGFDIMPDFGNEVTVFGGGQSVGNDFVGTFYDMKRDRRGRSIPNGSDQFGSIIESFVRSGWKTSKFARYYKAPEKLYTTSFMVPSTLSVLGPEAFGHPEVGGWNWCAHYTGQLVHKEGIKFRFWGSGDDLLLVRVAGEIVLNASYRSPNNDTGWFDRVGTKWTSSSAKSLQYWMGLQKAEVGDWIELEPGVPLDMEVLIGEVPGGAFGAMLCVEEYGVDYPVKEDGGPILPMFKTAEPSLDLIDAIYFDLIPGQACVTNGPVFSDYDTSVKVSQIEQKKLPEPELPPVDVMRVWELVNGKTIEAEFVVVMGDKVVLKSKKGRQKKVSFESLSPKDQEFVELATPPSFKIDFLKSSKVKFFVESPEISGWIPDQLNYTFGVRVKQDSSGSYNYELKVEFFAIGDEIGEKNYVLLDRQESSFTPTIENKKSYEFRSDRIVTVRELYTEFYGRRGDRYGGNLVVVSDERGQIIASSASSDWLLDILPQLRRLPVGRHFNKSGERVHPPRQKIPMHPDYSY